MVREPRAFAQQPRRLARKGIPLLDSRAYQRRGRIARYSMEQKTREDPVSATASVTPHWYHTRARRVTFQAQGTADACARQSTCLGRNVAYLHLLLLLLARAAVQLQYKQPAAHGTCRPTCNNGMTLANRLLGAVKEP